MRATSDQLRDGAVPFAASLSPCPVCGGGWWVEAYPGASLAGRLDARSPASLMLVANASATPQAPLRVSHGARLGARDRRVFVAGQNASPGEAV